MPIKTIISEFILSRYFSCIWEFYTNSINIACELYSSMPAKIQGAIVDQFFKFIH